MLNEDFYIAAQKAIDGYVKNKLFNLADVQSILDSLQVNIKLETHDKAEQAILLVVLAIQMKQRN
ncbi:hypothetical protein ACO03_11390 [Pantoea ananatis]|nr:hypothetical protein ACO03_11390 [Pantoea ananatis]